ncbi:MAG: hypothetical protein E6G39_01255 [Actinobacteria bacterium]|nr:MAG: hypothetical protein E6G39_01255 [Actinomycetota bacterium]
MTAPIPVGTTVYDTSTLSGSTTNAGGTVRYRIYTDNTCGTLLGGTAGNAFNTQTDKAVTNASPGNSDSITLNTAGTFYFQATYQTGDTNNVAGAMSTCSSEAVTVQATPAPHSTPAIEIKDTITVSGLSASPSGNLVVGIYTNSACTTRLSGTSDVTFAIGSGPFNTDFVGPLGSGTYFYKLSYAGDTFNTGFSDCTEEVNATITSLP